MPKLENFSNRFEIDGIPYGRNEIKSYASSTVGRVIVTFFSSSIGRGLAVDGLSGLLYSDWTDENDAAYTSQSSLLSDMNDFFFNLTPLLWASNNQEGEPDLTIPSDTPTLLPLVNAPFASFNTDKKMAFDLANDWVDISGLKSNSWVTVRLTFLGVSGNADVTTSVRLIPDRNDLNTYFTIHGQTSRQQNGKTSSYILEFYNGNVDVLQFFIETDKNESIGFVSLTVKIEEA